MKWMIVTSALLAMSACSSSSNEPASGTDAGVDTGSDTSPAKDAGGTLSCADWSGTCAQTCPSGLDPIRGGGGGLCPGALDVCCVPGSAGSRVVKGSYGLLCTTNSFSEFSPGTCAGASCAVGGECRGGMCDLSRGLPPTKNGSVECAIFGCGSITCALGCSCKDAETSTCTCP